MCEISKINRKINFIGSKFIKSIIWNTLWKYNDINNNNNNNNNQKNILSYNLSVNGIHVYEICTFSKLLDG